MSIRKMLEFTKFVTGAVIREMKFAVKAYDALPSVLNYSVTGRCHSQCPVSARAESVRPEMSRDQGRQTLRHPFFGNVQSVWLSGGEITLLEDACERIRDICELLPKLKQIRISLDCADLEKTKQFIARLYSVAEHSQVQFWLGLSLNGAGERYDFSGSVPGPFENVVEIARGLQRKPNLSYEFDCAITHANCCRLDAALDFAERMKIPVKFYLATPVRRSGPEGDVNPAAGFSDKEKYLLELFFDKRRPVSGDRDRDEPIMERVLSRKRRSRRCTCGSEAVYLNPHGEIAVCAAGGKFFRQPEHLRAFECKKVLRADKKTLSREECRSCDQACVGRKTLRALIGDEWEKIRKSGYENELDYRSSLERYDQIMRQRPVPSGKASDMVLVVGWYGTETAGDKLILKTIVSREKGKKIIVASIKPYVTRWTCREIGENEVRVIPVYTQEFFDRCRKADKIIFGGGPLMPGFALGFGLRAFCEGSRKGKTLVVEGCGIGPVQEETPAASIITKILSLASIVRLRDTKSAGWARKHTGRTDIVVSGDPAEDTLRKRTVPTVLEKDKAVSFFLRKWPRVYADMPDDEYHKIQKIFDLEIVRSLDWLMQEGYRIHLIAMCHLFGEDDDRQYYRALLNGDAASRKMKNRLLPGIDEIYSPDGILDVMSRSVLNICMRYHSVVFAHGLKSEYIAIDYSKGGKIKSFLEDHGKLETMISLDRFRENLLLDKIKGALKQGQTPY
ncbi:MAG: polysaccharide pyruvyl transferase family protein [Candidatus Omnitrophica bacterium]|nr:polysaccharide pyruvyl transferase family protein [Candidatus Omnitrophota bacterium]MDD5672144.1 polysaccharide pyruvyl transferase family protein [Candidatus Omnitrophota bacterium]